MHGELQLLPPIHSADKEKLAGESLAGTKHLLNIWFKVLVFLLNQMSNDLSLNCNALGCICLAVFAVAL